MCLASVMTTHAAGHGQPEEVDFAFAGRITRWVAWVHADRPLILVAFVWAVAWLPLVALSAAEGRALDGALPVPFLRDVSANARVLVALPLLLLGSRFAEARLREAQRAFEETGLVDERCREPFRQVLRSSAAVVHSPWSEAALLAIALSSVAWLPLPVLASTNSWQATGPGEHAPLTLAGWWLATIVLPLYRYLLLRWALRFVVWAVALARFTRLELHLLPSHADRSAGLGFLGRSQSAFGPVVLALSIVYASGLGNGVLHLGAGASDLRRPVVLFCVVALAVWIAPLFVFFPTLARLKRRALLEHDALAARCSRAFETVWLPSGERDARALLQGDEVQSLSSLRDVVETVRCIKPVPLGAVDVVSCLAVAAAPMLPLVLSTVSPAELEQLLRLIVG